MRQIWKAATAVVILAGMTTMAVALDAPKRKPGLWEISTVGVGSGVTKTQVCIDQNDQILAPANTSCSEPKVTSDGVDTTIVDLVCTDAKGKEMISAAFTGSFDKAYEAQVKMTFDPVPAHTTGHLGVTIEGKYLGPDCPANAK